MPCKTVMLALLLAAVARADEDGQMVSVLRQPVQAVGTLEHADITVLGAETAVSKSRRAELQPGDAPEWFQQMMLQVLRDNMPEKYVDEKEWGKTDRRWDGLKVERDGLKVSTKRRWKEVNHGTWKRYEIAPIDPDDTLWMRIENVHEMDNGKVAFEIDLSSQLQLHARLAQWAKGVQFASFSADAKATVHLRIWCEISIRLDFHQLPPDVVVVPHVTRAELDVEQFELDRVSKLDGPLVHQLGNGLRRMLRKKIEEKQPDLPAKINRQLAKQEKKLRFSASEFASNKWNALTKGAGTDG